MPTIRGMNTVTINRTRIIRRTGTVPFGWTYRVEIDGGDVMREVCGRMVSVSGSHTLESARILARKIADGRPIIETWKAAR